MRRSTQVAAPLLAAAALALTTACRKPEMQRCVDENNHVVDDKLCANQPQAERRSDGHGGFIFIPMPYRYYYGGYGGYATGTVVGGGAYTPAPGRSYASSTSRGGFGGTLSGSGEGGHSGGEGGAGE